MSPLAVALPLNIVFFWKYISTCFWGGFLRVYQDFIQALYCQGEGILLANKSLLLLVLFVENLPNPFKVVQRSGYIRPMNPETSGQKILDYPGKARRLFAEYKSRFNFCQEKFSPALF